jgi:hypothetical protein
MITNNTWTRPNLLSITKAIIEMGEATMGEITGETLAPKEYCGEQIPSTKFFFHFVDGTRQDAIAYNINGETCLDW